MVKVEHKSPELKDTYRKPKEKKSVGKGLYALKSKYNLKWHSIAIMICVLVLASIFVQNSCCIFRNLLIQTLLKFCKIFYSVGIFEF